MKVFVLLLVIVLFILWKKNKNKREAPKDRLFNPGPDMKKPQPSSERFQGHPPSDQVDELIACCVCGVHVPKSQLELIAHEQYQCAKHR